MEAIDHVLEIDDKSIFKYFHLNGPLVTDNEECTKYQQLVTPSFTLKINNVSDSCCSIDNSVSIVQNFIECSIIKYVLYKKFKHKRNVYDFPINSELLNIIMVFNLPSQLLYSTIDNIKFKCMLIQ